jgi:hypothetical protein
VVHHVAANLIGAVGDTARIAVIGGQQQQLGRFDAIGCDDKGLAGDAEGLLVGVVVLIAVMLFCASVSWHRQRHWG